MDKQIKNINDREAFITISMPDRQRCEGCNRRSRYVATVRFKRRSYELCSECIATMLTMKAA
jgi:hypothetical protein